MKNGTPEPKKRDIMLSWMFAKDIDSHLLFYRRGRFGMRVPAHFIHGNLIL